MDGNPWEVDSLQDFSFLKCPECTFDTQELENFEHHALENHPLSFVFFGETFLKEENFESDERYSEDCKDPLITNGETKDQSDITPSENLALTPISPKLTNLKEDLIDDKSKFKLEKHVELIHEDKRSFGCSECDLKFKLKHHLKRHFSSVHDGKKFVDEWKKLKNKKNNEKIQCPKCEIKIAPNNLKKHIKRVHDRIFPFLCNKCGYKATDKFAVKKHIESVHDGKRHICQICGIGVTSTIYLKKHITAVHEGIKAFKCSLCDKKFSFKNALYTHNKSVHERKKSHMCAQCGASFSRATTLSRHIKGVHEKETPYVCKICNHGFKQNGNLKYHMDTVHKEKENI